MRARRRDDNGFAGDADFWFPDEDLLGEADGRATYFDPALRGGLTIEEVVYSEKLREDRLRRLVRTFSRWDARTAVSRTLLTRHLREAGLSFSRERWLPDVLRRRA